MTDLELAHALVAMAGLALGVGLLATRKGSTLHRRLGRGFVAAMLMTNGTALLSYEDGRLSLFHGLALVSLACLASGLWALRRRGTLGGRIDHATWMSWTFVGLVAAGAGQAAVLLGLPAPFAILGIVAGAYWTLSIRKLPIRMAERMGDAGERH